MLSHEYETERKKTRLSAFMCAVGSVICNYCRLNNDSLLNLASSKREFKPACCEMSMCIVKAVFLFAAGAFFCVCFISLISFHLARIVYFLC